MKKRDIFVLSIILLIAACQQNGSKESAFELREGDLLFQDLDCGDLCTAIETVTQSANGAQFSHIGMIVKNKENKLVVIEATSPKVKHSEINDFINKNKDKNGNPKVMVARLKEDYQFLVPKACSHASSFIDKAYDDIYVTGNDSLYCSELVFEAYKMANAGLQFFKLAPMTFNDPTTSQPFPTWVEYYQELGKEIPEGKPGINPGGISLSDKIDIVHWYYVPQSKIKE